MTDRIAPAERIVLALDAAGAACSVALWRDGGVRASRMEAMRRGQSERLVPMIQEVLAEAKTGFRDLDAVATTVGPGGFTGVRIGLATARGLALAWRRPLLGFSNFLVLAAAAEPETGGTAAIAALIDAKRRDLYAQAFDAGLAPLGAPVAVLPEALEAHLPEGPLLLVGDGVPQALPALRAAGRDPVLSKAPGLSDAVHLARLAAAAELPPPGAPAPAPLYLRPPDVTLPGAGPGRAGR